MTSLPLFLAAAWLPATALADPPGDSDGVCDNANNNADPDCADPDAAGGGPPTCGHADTADYAETCDDAYAAETCDSAASADTCEMADTALTCGDAATAESCDTATTADVADTVAECVSGVWGTFGASGPDCGPLSTVGPVGIGTEPVAMLDVAGTVHLRGAAGQVGLYVDEFGQVGIGTDAPEADLDVAGVLIADAIELAQPVERWLPVLPAVCAGADPWASEGYADDVTQIVCPLAVPAGGRVTGLECAGAGTPIELTLKRRDATFAWTDEIVADTALGAFLALSPLPPTGDGSTVVLEATGDGTAQLIGCRVRYELEAWL